MSDEHQRPHRSHTTRRHTEMPSTGMLPQTTQISECIDTPSEGTTRLEDVAHISPPPAHVDSSELQFVAFADGSTRAASVGVLAHACHVGERVGRNNIIAIRRYACWDASLRLTPLMMELAGLIMATRLLLELFTGVPPVAQEILQTATSSGGHKSMVQKKNHDLFRQQDRS